MNTLHYYFFNASKSTGRRVLVFQYWCARCGGLPGVGVHVSEYPQPTTPPAAVKPWDACDVFIWVYLPESAVEKFEEAAKEGYAGSSGEYLGVRVPVNYSTNLTNTANRTRTSSKY